MRSNFLQVLPFAQLENPIRVFDLSAGDKLSDSLAYRAMLPSFHRLA